MGTITEKLQYLNETKNKIKQILISKGQEVLDKDTFRSYVDKIDNIQVSQIFSSEDEMNKNKNFPENSYAIVYGTSYVGTYRLNSNKEWIQIGKPSDGQEIMDVLNVIDNETELYDGYGGTKEEIMTVLNKIFETTDDDNSDNDEIPTMSINARIRDESISSSENPSDVYIIITDSSNKELSRVQYNKKSSSQEITDIPFKKNGYETYLIEIDNGIETIITKKQTFTFSMSKQDINFYDRIAPLVNYTVKIPMELIKNFNNKFPMSSISVASSERTENMNLDSNGVCHFRVTKGRQSFRIYGNSDYNLFSSTGYDQLAFKSITRYDVDDFIMEFLDNDFNNFYYVDFNELKSVWDPTGYEGNILSIMATSENDDEEEIDNFMYAPEDFQQLQDNNVSNVPVIIRNLLPEDTKCKLMFGSMSVSDTNPSHYPEMTLNNCTIEHDGIFRKIVIPKES